MPFSAKKASNLLSFFALLFVVK